MHFKNSDGRGYFKETFLNPICLFFFFEKVRIAAAVIRKLSGGSDLIENGPVYLQRCIIRPRRTEILKYGQWCLFS